MARARKGRLSPGRPANAKILRQDGRWYINGTRKRTTAPKSKRAGFRELASGRIVSRRKKIRTYSLQYAIDELADLMSGYGTGDYIGVAEHQAQRDLLFVETKDHRSAIDYLDCAAALEDWMARASFKYLASSGRLAQVVARIHDPKDATFDFLPVSFTKNLSDAVEQALTFFRMWYRDGGGARVYRESKVIYLEVKYMRRGHKWRGHWQKAMGTTVAQVLAEDDED